MSLDYVKFSNGFEKFMFDFILAGFTISEKNDVTLPVGVCCDGFFVTHARGYVRMQERGIKLPPREAWRGAVPVLDAENPPARLSRDAPVQKSNFMAYNIHVAVVRDRDERDFFAGFGLFRLFGRLRLFGIIYHNRIIPPGGLGRTRIIRTPPTTTFRRTAACSCRT